MGRLIFIIVIAAPIIWLVVRMLRDFGSVFRIEIRHRNATIRGAVPGRSWPEVRGFLADLPLPNRCTITGLPDGKRFRLVFSGDMDDAVRQRIRNFLYLNL